MRQTNSPFKIIQAKYSSLSKQNQKKQKLTHLRYPRTKLISSLIQFCSHFKFVTVVFASFQILIINFPFCSLVSMKSSLLRSKAKLEKNKQNKNKSAFITKQPIQPSIYQNFIKYLNNRRSKFLKERLSEYYGKNFTVKYKSHYAFQQEWQDRVNKEQSNIFEGNMHEFNKFELALSVVMVLVLVSTIWLGNIDFFFREESGPIEGYQEMCVISIIIEIIDFAFKLWKKIKRTCNYTNQITIIQITRSVYKNIICIVYLSLKIAEHYKRRSSIWTIIEIVVTYLMYCRASKIYQSLRYMSFSLEYEYQSKVFDLIITLLIIMHFVAIILYVATFLQYQNTWMTVLGLTTTNQFIKYLYSFYFGATTVLTVGYGDITPRNPAQVAIVTTVEIVGIVMFAYIINQIGYSISSLRKDREIVEKDLSTMEKIKKQYKLSDALMNRARNYLINHKPKVDQLAPEEESSIMLKFNEELRNDISEDNSLAVIKSSIFFLCRWSKAFQKAVSLRLKHVLFSPNDIIYQPSGKQRIYIIRSGKVNIYAQRNGRKKGINNLLKNIVTGIDHQISDNCYGYTAVMSTRPTRLYAYAQDFTSAYFINKENFDQCVNQRSTDFEYYHQIRSKFDQSNCWEAFEAPLLQSSKHHYNPTKITLIRKHCKKNRGHNQRKNHIRNSRSKFQGIKQKYHNEDLQFLRYRLRSMQSHILDTFDLDNSDRIDQSGSKRKLTYVSSHSDIDHLVQQTQTCTKYTHFLESSKDYANYFPKKNMAEVLNRYENQYFLPKCNQLQIMELNVNVYKSMKNICSKHNF